MLIDIIFVIGYVIWLIIKATFKVIEFVIIVLLAGLAFILDELFPGPSQEELLKSAVRRADTSLARAHSETRQAMNIAAGQSYRNIIE